MQTNEIQELLLDTIPAWHYWFARPFKRMLNDGVSLDMYYCIQSMRRSGRTMTMTELANFARMPKQQIAGRGRLCRAAERPRRPPRHPPAGD